MKMTQVTCQPEHITGIVLAGGRGQRMQGQDKGLVRLENRPLIEYAIDAVAAQSTRIIISANRNLARYRAYGHTVVPDDLSGFEGPLAGIESALKHIDTAYALCLPCDCPHPPPDLARRLCAALNADQAQIAFAHDGERPQPLFCLLAKSIGAPLRAALAGGERKALAWMQNMPHVMVEFSDQRQAFRNFNTLEALEAYADASR